MPTDDVRLETLHHGICLNNNSADTSFLLVDTRKNKSGTTNYICPPNNLATDSYRHRLDIVHEVALLSTGNHLYQAPLKPERIHRVLDLGTGTGIWAIDFARQNSQSEVYGMDLRYGYVPCTLASNVLTRIM